MVGILCFVVFGAALVAGLIYSYKKLNVQGANLTAFDRFLKPELVENPVFFEKKVKKNENSDNTVEIADKSEDNTEDSGDGTDN